MNENELDKLRKEIESFFLEQINELDFRYEYEGDYDGDMIRNEANYIIIMRNTPSALQRIVLLRNLINKSENLEVYEFLEEQVADQMADADEFLVVDFYISNK